MKEYKNSPKPILEETGFTLIELVLVVGILMIVATFGFVSLGRLNQGRDLLEAQVSLRATFAEAKSRSIARIKPATYCGATTTLVGYRVNIFSTYYVLDIVCANSAGTQTARQVKRTNLPSGITLSSTAIAPPAQKILFNTSGQATAAAGFSGLVTVSLTKDSDQRFIDINQNGVVN